MPVTIPVVEPTVATVVLSLVQMPPEVASLSKVVRPTHAAGVPVIGAGTGLTVTTTVAIQPVNGNV